MNLSRRDFAKLSAMGIAAQLAPRLSAEPAAQTAPPASDKVGYCLIGLGRISTLFAEGILLSSNSRITALVSGHPEKAAEWAAKYGVPSNAIYSYQDMDKIRDNKAIDAVYIGLPNSMHAEYTIRSAKAGKHVLCEKPMATTVPEAESMIAACQDARVKLMIAYRCHYETTNLRAVKLLRDGVLGKLQSIQSAFGFSCDPKDWRVQKALSGGGPLFDVGIYSLNACRYLTGEEPTGIAAFASSDPTDPRFRDVEENVAWTMKFPSGVVATCNTTYGSNMDGFFKVYGSKGWLAVDPAFGYDGLILRAEYFDQDGKFVSLNEPNLEKIPYHFKLEANHFSACVLENKTPKTPGEEGLRDMRYIREIYRSAGIHMA
jgi:predicted dehydrogenase